LLLQCPEERSVELEFAYSQTCSKLLPWLEEFRHALQEREEVD